MSATFISFQSQSLFVIQRIEIYLSISISAAFLSNSTIAHERTHHSLFFQESRENVVIQRIRCMNPKDIIMCIY